MPRPVRLGAKPVLPTNAKPVVTPNIHREPRARSPVTSLPAYRRWSGASARLRTAFRSEFGTNILHPALASDKKH